MEITLEKIDQVRDRTGASYKEAKEALEVTNGNVIDAIIHMEEKQNKKWTDNISGVGNDVLETLKDVVKKGNVTKIVLKRDGAVIMNVPVTAGAVGAVLAPQIAIFGGLAALVSKCRIEIVKTDGEVVDINEMAEETLGNVKNAAEGTLDNVKSKVNEYKNKGNLDKEDVEINLNKDKDEEE